MGKALYAVYAIIMVGLLAAIGIPFLNGYFSAKEKVGECVRISGTSEQDRCLREAQKQVKVNAEFGKAIGSVLSGDSSTSARAE